MLKYRSSEQEQMDDLSLAGDKLHQTLDGLSVINRYLGNTKVTFRAVKNEILASETPLKIVDLGCGGSDNLRKISAWCNANDKPAKLYGIDGNAHILKYAEAKNTDSITVNYQQADILANTFEIPECDILISSHFMYHFSDNELILFLEKAQTKVSNKIIFSELERNRLAYFLFKVGSIFLPFSKMVKQDGLKAVRRSFKKNELISICKRAGIDTYTVKWKWAFRLLVSINLTQK